MEATAEQGATEAKVARVFLPLAQEETGVTSVAVAQMKMRALQVLVVAVVAAVMPQVFGAVAPETVPMAFFLEEMQEMERSTEVLGVAEVLLMAVHSSPGLEPMYFAIARSARTKPFQVRQAILQEAMAQMMERAEAAPSARFPES